MRQNKKLPDLEAKTKPDYGALFNYATSEFIRRRTF